jgi:hypothetical protein
MSALEKEKHSAQGLKPTLQEDQDKIKIIQKHIIAWAKGKKYTPKLSVFVFLFNLAPKGGENLIFPWDYSLPFSFSLVLK